MKKLFLLLAVVMGNLLILGCSSIEEPPVSDDPVDFWEKTSLSANRISCLEIGPNDYIYVGTFGYQGLFRSTDNGQTWETINDNILEQTKLITFLGYNSDINYLFAAFGTLFYSNDDGESWTKLSSTVTTHFRMVASNGYRIYAGGSDRILSGNISTSGNQISLGLSGFPRERKPLSLISYPEGNSYYVGSDRGLYRKIDNSSEKWELIGLKDRRVVAIAVNSWGKIFAGCEDENGGNIDVFSSTNEKDWISTELAGEKRRIACLLVDSNDDLYAGTRFRGIFRLRNKKWTEINTGIPETIEEFPQRRVTSLRINSWGYLYVGMDGQGLYRSKSPIE